MANQQLYDKQYKIPPDILKGIQATLVSNPTGEGVKRAKFMLNNGSITYQAMKRLKNFFDYFNPQSGDKMQYALAGGDGMKRFIETTLATDRKGVQMGKNARQGMVAPSLNEEEKKKKDELKKNAVAVIVNEDNKILLLKRGSTAPWMPSKWSLVGGGIDKGETAQQAVEREILEETGLEIKKFVNSFSINRHGDSVETVFCCRYGGEPTDIKLDTENSNYGWYDVDEMEYLDTVPHLMEYIVLVFKNYED
jgi:8-oxo-dGTP pyrophosphatase MutT (NUDIX family)